MFSTSAPKVSPPMLSDFLMTFLNYSTYLIQLNASQSLIHRQLDLWIEPELGLSIRRNHMHVNPWFLAREKVKPVLPMPKYRRTHRTNLPDARPAYNRTFEARDASVIARSNLKEKICVSYMLLPVDRAGLIGDRPSLAAKSSTGSRSKRSRKEQPLPRCQDGNARRTNSLRVGEAQANLNPNTSSAQLRHS